MKACYIILTCWLLAVTSLAQPVMHMKLVGQTAGKRMPFYMQIGKRAVYHLYVSDTLVNYTGKKRPAMAINGSIPAPVLNFTEGDTAEIYVHNEMKMETSVHWHGLLLPNRYDGVSYLTTSPVKAGETHLYNSPLCSMVPIGTTRIR
jgi:FtsP/CotA-like multicopper oxidase with cupredoxin domain